VTGKDSFSYSGYLDTRGYTVPKLAGSPLELRVGGAVFTGAFTDMGQAFIPIGAATSKHPAGVAIKYSPKNGTLQVRIKGADLATKLGLPTQSGVSINKTFQTLVLGLDIGPFRTTEVLKMATHASSRGALSMAFVQNGKHPVGFSRAGGCQIVTCQGYDTAPLANPQGDRWLVRCLTLPGQDNETLAPASQTVLGGTSTTIQLGDYSQTVTLTKEPVRLIFQTTPKAAGIYKLYLDPVHFVCRLETNVLMVSDTNIPAAINSRNPIIFPFGVSFTGFDGQTSRIITPNNFAWNIR
jgi:hypothetical protein